MQGCTADVIGLDWAVDIADARRALGGHRTIQVCFSFRFSFHCLPHVQLLVKLVSFAACPARWTPSAGQ